MQVIQSLLCFSNIINVHIRHLLERRFLTIADGEDFDPDIHGYALVVEPSDTLDSLLADADGRILKGLIESEPLVIPPECVEEHPDFYDLVFVPGDGDFGITVVVPKEPGIDPALLSLCAQIATPAPSEIDG
jgi:hypothetical protein